MLPGKILNIAVPVRAYDELNDNYWAEGLVLILDVNEYDVTFLCGNKVLYSSQQEMAVELELCEVDPELGVYYVS